MSNPRTIRTLLPAVKQACNNCNSPDEIQKVCMQVLFLYFFLEGKHNIMIFLFVDCSVKSLLKHTELHFIRMFCVRECLLSGALVLNYARFSTFYHHRSSCQTTTVSVQNFAPFTFFSLPLYVADLCSLIQTRFALKSSKLMISKQALRG
jgi:hypothetical protein